MKNLKFNKTIILTSQQEEKPKKKKSWDRYIYIAVLLFLVGSFLKWLLSPYIFHTADGLLLQQQYDVNFPYDVRILEHKTDEGCEVEKGDTLFFYEKYVGNVVSNTFLQDSINIIVSQNKDKSSLIALDTQIEKRRLFIEELKKRLEFWQAERDRKERLVFLDAITANELANVDRSIDAVTYELTAAQIEYQLLLRERSALSGVAHKNLNMGMKNLQLSHSPEVFVSPVKGKVDRHRIGNKEVCFKGDAVTSVIYPDYFVRAYVEIEDLDEYELGDIVTVILPYGFNKSLKGKISRLYSVSEYKDKILLGTTFEDRKIGLVMEIIPAERKGWDKLTLSNIPVKVRK